MKNRFRLKGCFIFALILTLIVSAMPIMAFAETVNQWATKAPMAIAKDQFQTVVLNGKIYEMGGEDADNQICSNIEEYDPVVDTWTPRASMSTKRIHFKAEVIDGKIYAFGGKFNTKLSDISYTSTRLSSVEAFDSETNKWITKASMSTAREKFAIQYIEGKIYVFGGQNDSGCLTSVEEYDPVSDTWIKKASMSTPRMNFETILIGGKIYAIGGQNDNGPLSSIEEYDVSSDKWETKASMSTPRSDFKAVQFSGEIYAIGGRNGNAVLNTVEKYDPIKDTWTKKSPMSSPRSSYQLEVINSNFYCFGGMSAVGGYYLSSSEIYNPTSDIWTPISSMTNARMYFQTELTEGKIYVFGGSNGKVLSSVEEYTPASSQTDLPTTLTATAGDKQVTLSWSPVAGATGYNIYRSTTSGSSYSKIASSVTSTNYTDTGLTNGVTYYYYVKAVDSSGVEGQPSNEVSATPTASSSGGYNATLRITMVTGETKEYNVNSTVVESFIAWFNSKGSESPVFTFEKASDLGPYTSHTDYLAYDKISSFIVLKY